MTTFEALAHTLLSDAHQVVRSWFPNGHREGREWCVGDLQGNPGDSLKINCDSGKWKDFATGEWGQDLTSLYAAREGISQGEAALRLTGESVRPPSSLNGHTAHDGPPPMERPPVGTPIDLPQFHHGRHGAAAHVYAYRDARGELLFVVARYHTPSGKQFCPFTWRGGRWSMKGPDKPRPLYGLDRLETLKRRVVVVEGEKAADALQRVVRASPVITWPNGASNWRYADWSALRGRDVLLWPDADPPGLEAMRGIAGLLLPLQCTVSVLHTEGLPDSYDAADAVESGLIGPSLSAWIKERTKSVQYLDDEPPTQRVQALGPKPNGHLIEQDTGEISESRDRVPTYALGREFGLKMGRAGPHVNLANTILLVQQLVERNTVPPLWWDSFLQQVRHAGGEWQDHDTFALLSQLQHDYPFEKLTNTILDQAITLYAWQHPRNCAQEWLQALTWDGEPRLDFLLEDGFGCARTPYTMAVGRCFIMGMVARIMIPGCQVDTLPVFEGAQGVFKSKALRLLGGPWFCETTEQVTGKDFYLTLVGKMLVEIAEFASFTKGDLETIKAVIARPTDRYRLPYGKRPADHPRQCVFSATANGSEWNKDPTGARRYWPVRCGSINLQWLQSCREQLFAEAYARVMSVPTEADEIVRLQHQAAWWDIPEEEARLEQNLRYEEDSIAPAMRTFVLNQRDPFTTLNVLQIALGLDPPGCYDGRLQQRVKAQLIHWGYRQVKVDGIKGWVKV